MRLLRAALSVAVCLAGWLPEPAAAQPAAKSVRLCLIDFDRAATAERYAAFFEGLRALGYVEGRTLTLDWRSADGVASRFPALAADCVQHQPDVIVVQTTPAALAARKATTTIPIVMLAVADPVGSGLVESLARPGANVTGVSFMGPAVAGKRLELLKEAVPRLGRALVLSYPVDDPNNAGQIRETERVAAALGVAVVKREIRDAAAFGRAFEGEEVARAEAVVVPTVSLFYGRRREVLAEAGKHRWPGVYPWREYAEAGGLMSYSHSLSDMARRTAAYVDRIVKGSKAADLPVEQPTQFDFVVNLRAAKALGIVVPPSLVARATELIE